MLEVACWQHVELDAADLQSIAYVVARRRRPTLADIHRALGSGSRRRATALTAVSQGYLRLEPHAELSSSLRVAPGPMLDTMIDPFNAVANDRGGDLDGEAA
ncbi:hypothetical protein IFT71_12375 [Sphingomonas sp. CFBP 13733]|nr:hypothetical protein [Sphingomonas sp. CFBP 13733]